MIVLRSFFTFEKVLSFDGFTAKATLKWAKDKTGKTLLITWGQANKKFSMMIYTLKAPFQCWNSKE